MKKKYLYGCWRDVWQLRRRTPYWLLRMWRRASAEAEAASADTASSDPAGTAELGDDIYSFQLLFDGDLLKAP